MGERKLHIGEEVWTWRFSGGTVLIRNAERKQWRVADYDLLCCTPNDTERDAWKRNLHIMPRYVKEYIRTKILGLPPEDDSDQYGCICGGVYKHKGMAGNRRRFECTGCEGITIACVLCCEPRVDWAAPKQGICLLCCYYYQTDKLPIDQEEKLWALAEGKF